MEENTSLDDLEGNTMTLTTGNAHGGPDAYALIVTLQLGTSYYNRLQVVFHCGVVQYIHCRVRTQSSWGSWTKFEGIAV